MLSFLHHLVREPAFNQLRTEEQLGACTMTWYHVNAEPIAVAFQHSYMNLSLNRSSLPFLSGYIVHTSVKTNGERIKSLLFLIQSDAFDPQFMDERIEAFLVRFRAMLVQMNTEDFQANVDAVCQSLLEKNKNLFEESSKYWHVITNRSYHFRRRQHLAAEAKSFSKSDALRFFDKFILKGSPFRHKLAVHVLGNNHSHLAGADKAADTSAILQLVEDLEEFIRNQLLYPVQATLSIEEQMLDVDA